MFDCMCHAGALTIVILSRALSYCTNPSHTAHRNNCHLANLQAEDSMSESLNTLRFAMQVGQGGGRIGGKSLAGYPKHCLGFTVFAIMNGLL